MEKEQEDRFENLPLPTIAVIIVSMKSSISKETDGCEDVRNLRGKKTSEKSRSRIDGLCVEMRMGRWRGESALKWYGCGPGWGDEEKEWWACFKCGAGKSDKKTTESCQTHKQPPNDSGGQCR